VPALACWIDSVAVALADMTALLSISHVSLFLVGSFSTPVSFCSVLFLPLPKQ